MFVHVRLCAFLQLLILHDWLCACYSVRLFEIADEDVKKNE